MASLLERIVAGYAQPRQAEPSALGAVVAAPAPTQTERVAGSYRQRRPTSPPAPSPPSSRATEAEQRAQRDALHSRTTNLQRMAARYGTSSLTVPQASFPPAEYRRKTDEVGIDRVVATRVLDGLLAAGDDPSSIPCGAGVQLVRQRAQEMGINSDDAQRCFAVFLSLGEEPAK
jgi:hypothetical protein